MNWKRMWLLCLMGMATSLYAQDLSIKVNEKGQAGYVDAAGNEVVPCKYDAAYPFEGNLAKVIKGQKFGMLDKSGTLVVPLKWDEINYDEVVGMYRVKAGKKHGILDKSGGELLKAEYSYISPFNCYGKALLAKGGKEIADAQKKKNYLTGAKFGILNTDGTVPIPATYKGLYEFNYYPDAAPFTEGCRMEWRKVYIGDTLVTDCKYMGFEKTGASIYKAGVMNERGETVMPTGLAEWVFKPQGDMIRWYNSVGKKSFDIGYYDIRNQKNLKAGNFNGSVTGTNFWTHTDFMDDMAAVVKNSTWCIIDREGNTVKDGYKSLSKSTVCGIWRFIGQDGHNDFFGSDGKELFAGSGYTDAFFPRNEKGVDRDYLSVEKDGKWGLVSRNNQVKIPFQYDKINDSRYGWVPVKKNGKWGILSLEGNVVVPTDYDDVISAIEPNSTATYVKVKNLWYVYNVVKKREYGKGYENAGHFSDGIAWVLPANLTVEDNYVYRALNGGNVIDVKNFGYIINDEGQELVDVPMPVKDIQEIRQEILKKGKRKLTPGEVKKLLLKLSVHERHYPMENIIDESNWDY